MKIAPKWGTGGLVQLPGDFSRLSRIDPGRALTALQKLPENKGGQHASKRLIAGGAAPCVSRVKGTERRAQHPRGRGRTSGAAAFWARFLPGRE